MSAFGAFYLDTDTRQGRVYIASRRVDKKHVYLIWAADRWRGESLMKDLNLGKALPPTEAPELYELVEVAQTKFGNLAGEVHIYRLR